MKKCIAIFGALFLLVSLFAGCSDLQKTEQGPSDTVPTEQEGAVPVDEKSYYPLTITDPKGNTVSFSEEPQKIVSLGPNITEIIYALEKGDKLIGRTAYCDYPEEVLSVTTVGDFIEWDMETIISLEPDVVFTSSLNTEENENRLEELGIKTVFITDIQSFESVYETIDMIGRVLNSQELSNKVINDMKQTVIDMERTVEGAERPSVYYVVGYGESGDYTATGETFIASMLEIAGANNIAANETGWIYSLEKLVENDPEIILCSEEIKSTFQNTNGYKELSAVKEGRIYAVDEDILMRQGPRLMEGLLEMARILHPEKFPD